MTNRAWQLYVILMTGVLMILMAGCRRVDSILYSHYTDLPASGWPRYESKCFQPDSTLEGRKTDMTLNVRARASRPLPAIPVIVSVDDETGQAYCDTIDITMFNPDGSPMGKTRYGICEKSFPIMSGFTVKKGLSICLIPLAPERFTAGMLNIGITLEDHESAATQP